MKKAADRLARLAGRGARFISFHLALRWRLMLMLSLLAVVSLGTMGFVSVRIYSDSIIGKTLARKQEMGASVLEAIGIICSRDDYSATQICRNDDIMEALSYDAPQTVYLKFLEIRSCSKALMEIVDKSNIVGLGVLGYNGKTFFSKSESERTNDEALRALTDIPAVKLSGGESVWIPSKTDIFGSGKTEPATLYVVKKLYNIRNANGQDVGLSIAQVQYSRLYDILCRVTTGDEIYAMLSDQGGTILCTTKGPEEVAEHLPRGIADRIAGADSGSFSLPGDRSVLYLYNRDVQTGWVLIQAVPYSLIAGAAGEVRGWMLLVTAFCLIGALMLAVLFARSFANPVVKLEKVMRRFGGGELTARSAHNRNDEIGRLQESFNGMAERINGLLTSMGEEHRQKRMMEMRMLEYQINPHFLYNSLDSINWMANTAGNREIAEMATALAKFFRLGLNRGREVVRVFEEAEHARNFLLISKIRYHDGFSYDVAVEPEARDYKIVKLIIQPLAENCLVHGISKTGSNGHVEIKAFTRGDRIVIEVRDNGKGIPAGRLAELQAMLDRCQKGGADGDEGIGMMNVQQRIRLYYGAEYGIELESVEGEGTTARVVLPRVK